MEGRNCTFNSLPDELQLAVFERLFRSRSTNTQQGGDLVRAMQVCHQWHRLCTSDELWQGAYLAYAGRMTEEKERKIKSGFYELKHRLEEQQMEEEVAQSQEEQHKSEKKDHNKTDDKERKRKRLMHWVKSHVSDEALHHLHRHQPHGAALSWLELTRTRHLKAKKLAAIKLKPLPLQPGEVLIELASNSESPDGDIRVRYLNSLNPNVSDESDTTRTAQSDTTLPFLPPVPNQRSDILLSYFETRIEDRGQRGYISVGIAPVHFDRRNIQVGWDPRSKSYGYHGDDGHKFPAMFDSTWNWMGEEYGPQFTTGDVVGCGVIVRKVTLEEANEKAHQALEKRAKVWKKVMSGADSWLLVIGGKGGELRAQEEEEEEEKESNEEALAEPDDTPQEKLHFLLEWEEHKRHSLLSRASKVLFGGKGQFEYRSHLAKIFWTKNGQFLGLGYKDVIMTESDDYRATVGLHSPGETVSFNFGRSPFVFDVDNFMLNYPASLGQPVPPPFKREGSEADEVYSEGEEDGSDVEDDASDADMPEASSSETNSDDTNADAPTYEDELH